MGNGKTPISVYSSNNLVIVSRALGLIKGGALMCDSLSRVTQGFIWGFKSDTKVFLDSTYASIGFLSIQK